MENNLIPTKGNLLDAKKSLQLAKVGFELLDRKRNILIREMLGLIDEVKTLRDEITATYNRAYFSLQKANITLGICAETAKSIPIDNSVEVHYRSVMGVELPTVKVNQAEPEFYYGFTNTNSQLDKAYICFHRVKLMTARLAELENSIYRLANAIKKTQGRANALQNIIIPNYEFSTKYITDALEEKEREEFSRLKVIKTSKRKKTEAKEEK